MYHLPTRFQSFPHQFLSTLQLAARAYTKTAVYLLGLFIVYLGLPLLEHMMHFEISAGHSVAHSMLMMLGVLMMFLVTILPVSMLIKVQDQFALDPKIVSSPFNILKQVSRHWLGLVLLCVYAALGVSLGLMLFVLPGVYLVIAFGFSLPGIILEDQAAFTSLKKSYLLVKGRWWLVFGRFAMLMFMSTLLVLIFHNLFFSLGVGFGARFVLTALLKALITPFITAFYLILFYNLKLEKIKEMSQKTELTE